MDPVGKVGPFRNEGLFIAGLIKGNQWLMGSS